MPLPERGPDEQRDAFLKRCMGDEEAVDTFPDAEQRYAVCNRQADKKKEKKSAPSASWSDGGGGPLALKATLSFEPIEAARSKDGEADAGPPPLPKFTMVANTGATPMRLAGWKYPVVIDFEGMRIPSQMRPIRMNHDEGQGVGHTTSIAVEGGVLVASGVVSRDTPAARDVVASGRNGFPWQASVGASAEEVEFVKTGEKVVVNGNTFEGPINVARKTVVGEISFVDLGADENTSAMVAASAAAPTPASHQGASTMFEQWLQAKGFSDPAALDETQTASLRALFDAEQAARKPANNGNGNADGNGNGATPPTPTLDQIFAEQRLEVKRVDEITQITAREVGKLRLTHPHLIPSLEREARTAIEAKTDPKTYELDLLRRLRELQGPGGAGGSFSVHGRVDAKATARTIEAALCRAAGLDALEKHYDERTLDATDAAFRHGLSLQEMLLLAARDRGWAGHSVRGDIEGVLRAAFPPREAGRLIQAQGWSTYSLATILGNVANKFLAQGFNAVEDTWRSIASRRPVDDFKQITTAALTGGFTFEKVGAGGELKHAAISELTYTDQAETYGKMFSITRKDIINDDLGAFSQIRTKLGRGGALGLNRDFWTVFLNNSSFFTSGRGNLGSGAGTALSLTQLGVAQQKFRDQTDPDGDPISVTPKILLVPNALEITAFNLVNSTQIANDTTANTLTFASNPFAGRFTVKQSSYLSNSSYTGYSTTAWYLLADPNDLPTVNVVFLNGKESPTVESADADFNVLGIQFRAYFDYGISLHEYRGGVKMAGA